MLFAVDIGNTQTVLGIFEQDGSDSPRISWRIATNKTDTADDIASKLLPLIDAAHVETGAVAAAVMASVVPPLTHAWRAAINALFSVDVMMCTAQSCLEAGLFEADYPNPSEIGSDRVADAVAVKALYGYPAIVVDFGTATNMEVIDERGKFVGGVIAPGLQTGADALFTNASGLASMEMVVPPSVIGKNTAQALQAGIILGEAARVDGLIDRIFEALGLPSDGQGCTVVATGGLAKSVAAWSRHIMEVAPDLTLFGLVLLARTSGSQERSTYGDLHAERSH